MHRFLLLFALLTALAACQDDDITGGNGTTDPADNFDRRAMLAHWADDVIVPGYEDLAERTLALRTATTAFADAPDAEGYAQLTDAWETAYRTFQRVSMFEIGPAETLRFTNQLNVYPTDVEEVTGNVLSGSYNLDLPSQVDAQGFPALDYLLHGIADDPVDFYQNHEYAAEYGAYLTVLATRIDELTQSVLTEWTEDYRDRYVENSGNSATASVDKTVNDFVFYYEKHLRAGKVGIPAGVFSGNALPNTVEARYRGDLNRAFLLEAVDAVRGFFRGNGYGDTGSGPSMEDYLRYLEVEKNGAPLAEVIEAQFEDIVTLANKLDDSFAAQIESDNNQLLETYDALQRNVVYFKVDMLQAFNVNVDYVDADGD